ncbi:hypothetical protein GBAR_LOCUS30922 [Geodia barretti]|uniref:Uncharacterized protein n=1 Tax=Geodia barretti TaxID=519541 RepID=A0AA35TYD0_GEOBA|nr:hypothetical protein GBAR_LOCUS30922 [Geodia barretti]
MLTLVAQFKKNIADGLLYGSNSDGLHLLWEGYRDLPGRSDVDEIISNFTFMTLPATDVFAAGQKLLFVFDIETDRKRLVNFCRLILAGMETNSVKV